MNHLITLFLLASFTMNATMNLSTFKKEQLSHQRVQEAYDAKLASMQALLRSKNINPEGFEVYFRAFKLSESFEVWVKDVKSEHFVLLKKYPFCTGSGVVGPKRRQGDMQVPEGCYEIDRFNPWSNFHLSLGIDYPNASDRKLSPYGNLGGDIFIHGNCVTIGCIPLTDDKIKEVYVLAVEAKNNGQQSIPVHIFPWELTDRKLEWLQKMFPQSKKNHALWKNLQEAYVAFEAERKVPQHRIGSDGYYDFE